jgi:serine/threonine protein kinase
MIGSAVIGQTLSHYRILAPLGRGAMGEVFEAEDVRLGRRVALKLLPQELCCDPAAVERFQREARIVSALSHPNICTLYDIGAHHDRQFMVMELLEGEPLSARLARGPLPLDDVLGCAIDVATALDAAHRQGVIHRDIKPANLYVTRDGTIKVLDFGVAKLSDAAADLESTRAGSDQLTGSGTRFRTGDWRSCTLSASPSVSSNMVSPVRFIRSASTTRSLVARAGVPLDCHSRTPATTAAVATGAASHQSRRRGARGPAPAAAMSTVPVSRRNRFNSARRSEAVW